MSSGGTEFNCDSVNGVGASGAGAAGVTTLMADLDFFACVTTDVPRRVAGARPRVDRRVTEGTRKTRGAVVARTAIVRVDVCENENTPLATCSLA
jgi:hypothetical protein